MHCIDRANAVTNLIIHLSAHPQLSRALPLQNHHQFLGSTALGCAELPVL